jgi:CheY-like chemotaxis protein
MGKILFLDDNKERSNKLKSYFPYANTVETSMECIEQLEKESFQVVMLDHDLGGQVFVNSNSEDTVMEVVRWIVKNKPKNRTYYCS